MSRNTLVSGLLGGVVMFVWLFITNAVLPFKSDMLHNTATDQWEVHQALKANITEPGTYSCPYLSWDEEASFPDYRNQPVFTIIYSGYTHGAGSGVSGLLPVVTVFVTTIVAAWMLSAASRNGLSGYFRRVVFIAAIGVIISLYGDIQQMIFGPLSGDYLTFLAVNDLIAWTLAGLVMAWRVRPAGRMSPE